MNSVNTVFIEGEAEQQVKSASDHNFLKKLTIIFRL
jgi:hypothetical protein